MSIRSACVCPDERDIAVRGHVPECPQSGPTTDKRPQKYPIDPPEDDPRFTLGMTVEVAEVLHKHGYEKLEALDIVDLQQALFRFLYIAERFRKRPYNR